MYSHLVLQLTSLTIICPYTRHMHPAGCHCPMPSHLFPRYCLAEAAPFIPQTASFQGSITGSTDLFVGALFTPPFFVTRIVKGNNRRWRGDGPLTQQTRSHHPRFFEVIRTVNMETTPIREVTWWSKFGSQETRVSISTKSQHHNQQQPATFPVTYKEPQCNYSPGSH